MSLAHTPQKENERRVYQLIIEGKEMTAAELRERTGMSKGEMQSCLHRLHNNGYIKVIHKSKNGKVWGPN